MWERFIHNISYSILVTAVLLSSCGGDEEPLDRESLDQTTIEEFLAADSTIVASLDESSGIWVSTIDENPGGSALSPGDIVEVYFVIRALDDVVIDISDSINGGPAKMLYGANSIYPVGFDQALGLMRSGEKSRFFIPSTLAYQDISITGLIPEFAVLDVTVQILDVLSVSEQLADETGDIQEFLLRNDLEDIDTPGTGIYIEKENELDSGALPGVGEDVEITYVATFLDGTPFDATTGNDTFEFVFGTNEVINGLDLGIGEMLKGESALIIIPSELAYAGSVKIMPPLVTDILLQQDRIPEYASRIGPYNTLVFNVTLLP